MDKQKLETKIAQDFFDVTNALMDVSPESITSKIEFFRMEVLSIKPQRGENIRYTLSEMVPVLEELKTDIDKVSDRPYYGSAVKRLRRLYKDGYDKASIVYQEDK